MTLAQIMTLALRQLDEDPEDIGEYSDLFKVYANQGLRIAAEDYVKPREERKMRSDENGDIPLFCDDRIVRVAELRRVIEDGSKWQRNVFWEKTADGLSIHTAWPDSEFIAVCEMSVPELERDTDEPQIPKSVHDALADYICYRALLNGNMAKQSRAQQYMQRFYAAMQRIRPQGMGSVTGYRNLYAVTDARYPR